MANENNINQLELTKVRIAFAIALQFHPYFSNNESEDIKYAYQGIFSGGKYPGRYADSKAGDIFRNVIFMLMDSEEISNEIYDDPHKYTHLFFELS